MDEGTLAKVDRIKRKMTGEVCCLKTNESQEASVKGLGSLKPAEVTAEEAPQVDQVANEVPQVDQVVAEEAPTLTVDEVTEEGPADPEFALIGDSVNFMDDGPVVAAFKDHFTLQMPSSTVRYRGRQSAARVVEGIDTQFVLEETINEKTKKHQIEIRVIHHTSEGVRALRVSYALVTAFWTGFLFVFCLQVLLFLVLDLAIAMGKTSKSGVNVPSAIGAVLSFPVLVYGFSSVLVIAGSYIVDTYRGHYLIRTFIFRTVKPVTVEWIFFTFFIGSPVLIMCCSLLSGIDRWWDITLISWFCSILSFFVLFCANVVWYEVRACWAIIQRRYHDENGFFLDVLNKCILLRQTTTYGGRKERLVLRHYCGR